MSQRTALANIINVILCNNFITTRQKNITPTLKKIRKSYFYRHPFKKYIIALVQRPILRVIFSIIEQERVYR